MNYRYQLAVEITSHRARALGGYLLKGTFLTVYRQDFEISGTEDYDGIAEAIDIAVKESAGGDSSNRGPESVCVIIPSDQSCYRLGIREADISGIVTPETGKRCLQKFSGEAFEGGYALACITPISYTVDRSRTFPSFPLKVAGGELRMDAVLAYVPSEWFDGLKERLLRVGVSHLNYASSATAAFRYISECQGPSGLGLSDQFVLSLEREAGYILSSSSFATDGRLVKPVPLYGGLDLLSERISQRLAGVMSPEQVLDALETYGVKDSAHRPFPIAKDMSAKTFRQVASEELEKLLSPARGIASPTAIGNIVGEGGRIRGLDQILANVSQRSSQVLGTSFYGATSPECSSLVGGILLLEDTRWEREERRDREPTVVRTGRFPIAPRGQSGGGESDGR